MLSSILISDLEAGCGEEANALANVRDIVRCPLVVVGA